MSAGHAVSERTTPGGRTDAFEVRCGVDSYLIDGGCIRAQTIHYEVLDTALSVSGHLMAAPGESGPRPVPDGARMPGAATS